MRIERIERMGNGIEVVVDGNGYFINPDTLTTKNDLKAELLNVIGKPDIFDKTKLTLFKEMVGTSI